MKTCRNLGHHERIIRIAVGLVLLALSGFVILPGWGDLVLIVVGLIALLTGIIGYCPAWHAVGINTSKRDHDNSVSNPKEGLHEHVDPTTHRS
jgi:glucose uptake protein GlcU